jgi:hypothetical protein
MRVLFYVTLILAAAFGAAAADYKIDWYSINSGGGLVTGGAYKLTGSLAQPATGFIKGTNYLHWVGFWAGDIPTPVVSATAQQAKLLQDGTYVSVSGKVATTGPTDRFSGFLYMEEADRSSGIRVSCPTWPVTGLARGSILTVIGSMGTTSAGERQVMASIVIITSSTSPLKQLGMPNRSVGGGDFGSPPATGQWGIVGGQGLNNIGLLAETWGLIVETGNNYLIIDDGSGRTVRIDTTGLSGLPTTGYISVIGLSSLYSGRISLILPRNSTDVQSK